MFQGFEVEEIDVMRRGNPPRLEIAGLAKGQLKWVVVVRNDYAENPLGG
jgi:hypothetical protein